MRPFLKQHRQTIAAIAMVFGGLLMASFGISHNHFTSGLGGLFGSAILIAGFVAWNFPKLKNGDSKTKKLTILLLLLLIVLLALDIVQWLLV